MKVNQDWMRVPSDGLFPVVTMDNYKKWDKTLNVVLIDIGYLTPHTEFSIIYGNQYRFSLCYKVMNIAPNVALEQCIQSLLLAGLVDT